MGSMKAAVAEVAPASRDACPAVDVAGFERWMAAEQKRIYLLCLRLLGAGDDADSATQDVFLKAYRALERGEITQPAKWLTRVAVNTCLDRLRSRRWKFWRRRAGPLDEETVLALVPATGPSPEDALHAREIALRLAAALDRLSPRQRSIFVLRHDEDRGLEEIGAILGLDVGTVKAHMARAVKKLRAELRDLYER
jgi:RNA polymerase sigma-70 factor (ECF subfamily)